MKTSDFYFDLPKELIAQDPLTDRASSRLLKLDRYSGEIEHRTFSDVTDYLRESDLLILNNTKVIPARLLGVKEDTGANVEVFLLKRHSMDVWETLVKPGKKLEKTASDYKVEKADEMDEKTIKVEIIKKVFPKISLDGKEDAYVDAMFDIAKSQEVEHQADHRRPPLRQPKLPGQILQGACRHVTVGIQEE